MSAGFEIRSISAVTIFVSDMASSVRFYEGLGFEVDGGGAESSFTSLRTGSQFLNLMTVAEPFQTKPWGRIIIHVDDVDAAHRRVIERGIDPQTDPRDAEWGERYFHVRDPDGHELSFARPLAG